MTRPVREGAIERDGLQVAYKQWGDDSQPALLCLHGWLDNAASFDGLAAGLDGVRVLAMDLAGHGRSGHRPPSVPYHYVDWVLDVLRVADILGLDRFSLMGHSMGASIASLVAGTCPDRVQRLVLLEGLGPRAVPEGQAGNLLQNYVELEQKARKTPVRSRPSAFETALRSRRVASPLSPASAELLARRGTEAVGDGVMWRNDRRLSRWQPIHFTEAQVREFLSRITCPTLAVTAADGLEMNQDTVVARKACIAELTEAHVSGQHHVHMDEPEVVLAHVAPFVTASS